MPVAVACPKCQKKFNLPEQMLGRPVKCSACGAQFKTPARARVSSAPNPKVMAAHAAAQKKAHELKQMGVEGLIQRAPDVFDGAGPVNGNIDPLANHLIEDPGFSDVNFESAARDTSQSENPYATMFENTAVENTKKKATTASKGKKKKRVDLPWYQEPWFLLTAIFTPLFIVAIVINVTEMVSPDVAYWITSVPDWAHSVVGLLGFFWLISLTYEATQSNLQVFLTVLVPFYVFYTLAQHWGLMKSLGYFLIANVFVSILAFVARLTMEWNMVEII